MHIVDFLLCTALYTHTHIVYVYDSFISQFHCSLAAISPFVAKMLCFVALVHIFVVFCFIVLSLFCLFVYFEIPVCIICCVVCDSHDLSNCAIYIFPVCLTLYNNFDRSSLVYSMILDVAFWFFHRNSMIVEACGLMISPSPVWPNRSWWGSLFFILTWFCNQAKKTRKQHFYASSTVQSYLASELD